MERTVLHIDCNKFYASVECLYRPEIRNKPVAVGGDVESRHGIILTKNEIASKYGLTVGEPLWKARKKCPDLIIVPPNYPLYLRFSKLARMIYADYSEFIEPFGLDENWIDVSGSVQSGEEIANEIRERVKSELGITVSVGVSFNKIFAKLGSDYKKPDAVTVISKDNFRDIVWPLPCGDLLMVGRATAAKLNSYGIKTIGELANTDEKFLKTVLGKNGQTLRDYANGLDISPCAVPTRQAMSKASAIQQQLRATLWITTMSKSFFAFCAKALPHACVSRGLRAKRSRFRCAMSI